MTRPLISCCEALLFIFKCIFLNVLALGGLRFEVEVGRLELREDLFCRPTIFFFFAKVSVRCGVSAVRRLTALGTGMGASSTSHPGKLGLVGAATIIDTHSGTRNTTAGTETEI